MNQCVGGLDILDTNDPLNNEKLSSTTKIMMYMVDPLIQLLKIIFMSLSVSVIILLINSRYSVSMTVSLSV